MNLFQAQSNEFLGRHIGTLADTDKMLAAIGMGSLEELIDKTIPGSIRKKDTLAVPDAVSEAQYLRELKNISMKTRCSGIISDKVIMIP